MKLQLFRNRIHIGHLIGHQLIGEYEGDVSHLLAEKGTSAYNVYHTLSAKETAPDNASLTVQMKATEPMTRDITISLCLAVFSRSPLSFDGLRIDDAERSLAKAQLALVREERERLTSATIGTTDASVAAGSDAQAVATGAEKLGEEPMIGSMINVLDSLVQIGDAFAEVRNGPYLSDTSAEVYDHRT